MAQRKLKSFVVKKNEKVEPIPFELADQKFEAYGAVSGAVLLDFLAAAAAETTGDTAKALLTYLERSMPESEWKRFSKLIHDPEILVELETLSDIVTYLIEERTDRPTEAS